MEVETGWRAHFAAFTPPHHRTSQQQDKRLQTMTRMGWSYHQSMLHMISARLRCLLVSNYLAVRRTYSSTYEVRIPLDNLDTGVYKSRRWDISYLGTGVSRRWDISHLGNALSRRWDTCHLLGMGVSKRSKDEREQKKGGLGKLLNASDSPPLLALTSPCPSIRVLFFPPSAVPSLSNYTHT